MIESHYKSNVKVMFNVISRSKRYEAHPRLANSTAVPTTMKQNYKPNREEKLERANMKEKQRGETEKRGKRGVRREREERGREGVKGEIRIDCIHVEKK